MFPPCVPPMPSPLAPPPPAGRASSTTRGASPSPRPSRASPASSTSTWGALPHRARAGDAPAPARHGQAQRCSSPPQAPRNQGRRRGAVRRALRHPVNFARRAPRLLDVARQGQPVKGVGDGWEGGGGCSPAARHACPPTSYYIILFYILLYYSILYYILLYYVVI
jgi:hypothetical protein